MDNEAIVKHQVKSWGVDRTVKMYEERISYAKSHPRNPFFIEVIQYSKQRLLILKSIKNGTDKV